MNENPEENAAENRESADVYLPSRGPPNDGEELVCDRTAYVMLHQAQTGAPCLSFDVIRDARGNHRADAYPLTAYVVAGTQTQQTHANSVIVMKWSNLHPTGGENADESEDESDDDDEDDAKAPKMTASLIKHQAGINRIRCTNLGGKVVAAAWSELGRVSVWDLTGQLQAVDDPELLKAYVRENAASATCPLFVFAGHRTEGFAIDWNAIDPGVLATGDCRMDIHVWRPREAAATWTIDQRPLVGHTESVEDLQWSPNEPAVLASCSVDKSVRIWDVRAAPSKACMLVKEAAHASDVNVISWNRNEPFIVSGGDDGYLHVWDLRRFGHDTKTPPLATFKHHTEPVTTIDWHPTESSVFASGGGDDQIALWDLSVEVDGDADAAGEGGGVEEIIEGLPPQLLFIHQGQKNVKELRWHPQMPGVVISTAESGFNVFRTISV